MPVTQVWTYLDHAAVAPLSQPACDSLANFGRQAAEQGDTEWMAWSSNIEKLRVGLAHWISASPDEIVLVPNTTFGINLVAEGFPWRAGDNVVIPGGEFPSNHFPWENQRRKGVELRVIPSPGGRIDIDGMRRAIDSRTRLVAASWVGYASGYRMPVEDLCAMAHSRGALFFLDAIQGVGVFDLNVERIPIDFLAADGHKWMLGPEGAGFAYIRREHLDLLQVPVVGWNSVEGRYSFAAGAMEFRATAARFEGGSYNMAGLMALHASLELNWQVTEEHGKEAVGNRVLNLHRHAREGCLRAGLEILGDWPSQHRSGILLIRKLGEDPQVTRARLLENKIVVSNRGGGVRLSMHAYNTELEIERAIDCIARV